MKVGVVGLWHLGSVTAASLAAAGHEVVGIDYDKQVVADLNDLRPRVAEPKLVDLIAEGVTRKSLRFSDDISASCDVDVLWVTFDTPLDENDKADIAAVETGIERALPHLKPGACLFISSQVPVGFTAKMAAACAQKYPEKKIDFAYVPENLRLGKAIDCFTKPDRVIVGTASNTVEQRVRDLLGKYTDNFVFMGIESAEMTKHAINAFLGLSVTFINEIASICELVGADAKEVEAGLKSEERIGPKAYLKPGGAFCGGTLARDLVFLKELGDVHNCPTALLGSVVTSNEEHKKWASRRLKDKIGKIDGQVIAVLGLTYKAGTDTLRRSSSLELCQWLVDQGSLVQAHDPAVDALPPPLSSRVTLKQSAHEALSGARALIVATEWPEYRQISAEQLLNLMKHPLVLDANGFLRTNLESERRIDYIAVGKPS